MGYQQFSPLWKDIFSRECFDHIEKAATLESNEFHVFTEVCQVPSSYDYLYCDPDLSASGGLPR